MKLGQLKKGDKALILSVDTEREHKETMLANGLSAGTTVQIADVSRIYGMMYLRIGSRNLALRIARTRQIEVNKI